MKDDQTLRPREGFWYVPKDNYLFVIKHSTNGTAAFCHFDEDFGCWLEGPATSLFYIENVFIGEL